MVLLTTLCHERCFVSWWSRERELGNALIKLQRWESKIANSIMWKYITTTTALELDMSSFSFATIYEPIVCYLPDREVASPRIACWPRSSASSRSHREVMRDDDHIDIISYPPPRQVNEPKPSGLSLISQRNGIRHSILYWVLGCIEQYSHLATS